MTLRNNLKQIFLHYFSALISDLLEEIRFKGDLLNLQTEKIRAKISLKDLMSMGLERQTLFLYEE